MELFFKITSSVFLLLLIFSTFLFAQKKPKSKEASREILCLNVLPLFTAANVPAIAPQEAFSPLITSTEETPANLPGNGLHNIQCFT